MELIAFVGPPATVDFGGIFSRRGALWLLAGAAYPGHAGFLPSYNSQAAMAVVLGERLRQQSRDQ